LNDTKSTAVTFAPCVDNSKSGGKIMQKTSMHKCEIKTKQFAKICPLHWSLIRGQHITTKRKVNGRNVGNLEKEKRTLTDRQLS
jgi:hypothetical protein